MAEIICVCGAVEDQPCPFGKPDCDIPETLRDPLGIFPIGLEREGWDTPPEAA